MRLEAAGERDGPLAEMRLSYGVLVHVQGGRVWLRIRRPFLKRNLLSPWLLVLCRPSPRDHGSSLVDVRVQYEPLAIAASVIAVVFFSLVGGGLAVRAIQDIGSGQGRFEPRTWLALLFGPVALAWIVLHAWLGRRDLRALVEFVQKTVEATPIHGLTSRLSGPA